MRSLERGNVQSVTVMREGGREAKYFIEASPQYKNLNVFDHRVNEVKRDLIKKPNTAETVSGTLGQAATQSQEQKSGQKQDAAKAQGTKTKKKSAKV